MKRLDLALDLDGLGEDDPLDLGLWRPLVPEPVYHDLELLRGALDGALDLALADIAHPACELKLLGLDLGVLAEEDPGDLAVDLEVYPLYRLVV